MTFLTLGLFALVINAVLLWVTGAVAGRSGSGCRSRLLPAFLGGAGIGITRAVLNTVVDRRAALGTGHAACRPPVRDLAGPACGLVACAHDEPPPPLEDNIPADALPPPDVLPVEASAVPEAGRFVLTGIHRPIVASITETGIQGPDLNLGRYKKQSAIEWRGTAFKQTANLTVSGSGAEGIVGRNPFNLHVTPAPDGMVVNGLIGGQPSTVTIGKTRINGGFGRCGYDVTFQGQAYVGPRSCGKGRSGGGDASTHPQDLE